MVAAGGAAVATEEGEAEPAGSRRPECRLFMGPRIAQRLELEGGVAARSARGARPQPGAPRPVACASRARTWLCACSWEPAWPPPAGSTPFCCLAGRAAPREVLGGRLSGAPWGHGGSESPCKGPGEGSGEPAATRPSAGPAVSLAELCALDGLSVTLVPSGPTGVPGAWLPRSLPLGELSLRPQHLLPLFW